MKSYAHPGILKLTDDLATNTGKGAGTMNYQSKPSALAGQQWIGLPDGSVELVYRGAPQTVGAFFKRLFTARKGETKSIHISASSRYALFLNGQFLQNGPCKSDHWRQFYDTIDISGFLLEGANVLSAQVINFSTAESAEMGLQDGGPSAIHTKPTGPLLLLSSSGSTEDISTALDGWKALPDCSTQWLYYDPTWPVGSNQSIDGSRLPRDFHTVADQSPWLAAKPCFTVGTALTDQCGEKQPFNLLPRPIPLLYAKLRAFQRQMPQRRGEAGVSLLTGGTVPAGQAMAMELDAGELLTGYPRLKVSSGAGAVITFHYAECYITESGKGQRDGWENGKIVGYEDRFLPSGRGDLFMTFWFRTFRFVRVEITAANEDVAIESLDFIETGYPLERVSRVQSQANPWVEKLFHISANTLARCMHETYEDCPYYEQLQYTQDTRLEMLFTYALSADTRMARRTIEDYHCSLTPEGMLQSRYPSRKPQIIPGFALHWFFMLQDYYRQTGDLDLVRRYRATMDVVLDWFDRRIDQSGLFSSSEHWPYFDWVFDWKNGVPDAVFHGPSTLFNLLYVMGLQSATELYRLTGREAMAAEYEHRADILLKLIEDKCWDEKAGLYREGPDFRQFSQHAQVWAVMTGLAEGDRAQSILRSALTDPTLKQCSFTMMFFLFRALEKAGLYGETRMLWQKWERLLDLGCTTIPEIPTDPRSECHAWGALPLWDFPRYFLGVREREPGWKSVLIQPVCLWLGDCTGAASTPHGTVKVSWQLSSGKFTISGELPEGIAGKVLLPDGTQLAVGGAFSAECAYIF
jgi:hypothetical protein